MSSEKTLNYLLHKWLGADLVKRTEFNDNFGEIDKELKNNANGLSDHQADNTPHREATNVERKNKDIEDIFPLIEWKRLNGTLFKTSQLQGTTPEYSSRVVSFYDALGTTIVQQVTYSIVYDVDGEFISEVTV